MGVLEFDFGICADSGYDEDGHPELGLDHYGPVGQASGAKTAHIHPFGFDSRPLDPEATSEGTPTTGCSALLVHDGDRLSMMPLDDARVVAKLPKQRKGGSRQYCGDGNYAMFDGEDPAKLKRAGSYTVSVKYVAGDGATKAMLLSFNKRTLGEEEMTLLHGEGHGLTLGASGKRNATLMNAKGTAWFQTNDDGNTIAGKLTVQGACVLGDVSATGVATQLTMLPMFLAFQAFLTALQPFLASPAGLAGAGTAQPVAATALALQVALALPTTFSQKVKASS